MKKRITITAAVLIAAAILFVSLPFWPAANSQDRKKAPSLTGLPEDDQNQKEPRLAVIGGDGDLTVTAANTVLNNYAVLAANVTAGDPSFSVTDITDLDSSIPQLGPLAVGDLLMIIQMQGATIDTTDTLSYGNVTSLNSAGLYELVVVGSTAGNTVFIDGEGCISGLRNSYSVAGRTQVVRVPQFNNLTVDAAASIVPSSWDGTSGGVVAIQMFRALTINGSIDAAATGFRGGALDNDANIPGGVEYRSASSLVGAEKGEGIAGFQTEYDSLNGRWARGAPANGGGGGNAHNAGGGGGANGNNGNTWTGQGVMPSTPAAAWALDPGFIANGNLFTTSSGGGRGGYTYSANDQNALLIGPGNALWAGDNRREAGGIGGRPVSNDPSSRLFLGGGGGAGDANNNAGGAGGRGAGIVFLQAGSVAGSGVITANGQNGGNTTGGNNDAPGGGGAGGTIVVSSFSISGVSMTADGGIGGNQLITSSEAEGPGGGGGGGYIAIQTGSPSRSAAGGSGGTTSSTSLTEFTANGATNGGSGQNTAVVTTLPICVAPSAAPVSVSGSVARPSGSGIPRAIVSLALSDGTVFHSMTNSFGYFRFVQIPAGDTIILSVRSKGYQFTEPTQIFTPTDSLTGIAFVSAN